MDNRTKELNKVLKSVDRKKPNLLYGFLKDCCLNVSELKDTGYTGYDYEKSDVTKE